MGTSHLPNKPITDKEKKVILPRQKQPNYELRAAVKTMKLFFAISVLLALFTEGKGNSGMRQANHKNHALNMRQLLNAAVLRKDEALADFTGKAAVQYKALVVVDLTKLEEMLEQHFARIENHFASVEANVTENRASLESLKKTGLNFCQTGVAGCYTNCPAIEDEGTETERKHYPTDITFPKKFPGVPTVTAALNEINMQAPGESDFYGWGITTKSVTSSGFTLDIELVDRKITTFRANWIV